MPRSKAMWINLIAEERSRNNLKDCVRLAVNLPYHQHKSDEKSDLCSFRHNAGTAEGIRWKGSRRAQNRKWEKRWNFKLLITDYNLCDSWCSCRKIGSKVEVTGIVQFSGKSHSISKKHRHSIAFLNIAVTWRDFCLKLVLNSDRHRLRLTKLVTFSNDHIESRHL